MSHNGRVELLQHGTIIVLLIFCLSLCICIRDEESVLRLQIDLQAPARYDTEDTPAAKRPRTSKKFSDD